MLNEPEMGPDQSSSGSNLDNLTQSPRQPTSPDGIERDHNEAAIQQIVLNERANVETLDLNYLHSRSLSEALTPAYQGVIFAGALFYPAVMTIFVLVQVLAAIWFQSMPAIEISTLFFGIQMCAIVAGVGAIVGAFLAGIVGVLAGLLIKLFEVSFPKFFAVRTSIAIFGGSCGFVCSSGILMPFADIGWFDPWWLIPMLSATCMGQIGALLAVHRTNCRLLDTDPRTNGENGFQFRIKHLFLATAWISVVLALDQAFTGAKFIKIVLLWTAIQTVLVLSDRMLQTIWNSDCICFRSKRS